MEDIHQQFNALVCELVFPYLNQKDLKSVSKVCKTWNAMASDKLLWKTIKLNNHKVVHWKKLVNIIIKRETQCLDTRNMVIPHTRLKFQTFWESFSIAIRTAVNLKCIYLYKCPSNVLEEVLKHLLNLEVLDVLLINEPMTEILYRHDSIRLNIKNVCRIKNLIELRIYSKNTILFSYLPIFAKLPHLKTLGIPSDALMLQNHDLWFSLFNVNTSLMRLEINDCSYDNIDIPAFLKQFLNLKYLKLQFLELDYFESRWITHGNTKALMKAIKNLKNLECLEIANLWYPIIDDFKLEKCANLKKLYIDLSLSKNACEVHHFLIKLFKRLRKKLESLEVGFQALHTCEMCITSVRHRNHFDSVPIQERTLHILDGHEPNLNSVTDRNVIYFTIQELKIKIKGMMPNTEITLFYSCV